MLRPAFIPAATTIAEDVGRCTGSVVTVRATATGKEGIVAIQTTAGRHLRYVEVVVYVALTVGDAEPPALAPVCAPTVLDDPVAASVVVTDDSDSMTAFVVPPGVAVHSASVVVEIGVDVHRDFDGAVVGNSLLSHSDVAGPPPTADLSHPAFPSGTGIAGQIHRLIGETRLVHNARVLSEVHGRRGIPSLVAGTITAEEEMSFGQVGREGGIVVVDLQSRLYGGIGAESHARAATALVLDRGRPILTAHVAPVNAGRRVGKRCWG